MAEQVMEKKKDIASKLNSVAEGFLQLAGEDFADDFSYFSEKIGKNVVALLDVGKPKVMVYGIYNSGKSTLINSLCREEVAETADRPMTARIAEYDRGDYFLVDSPGVNAPIEHEIVTEEYLNQCHIILFVISSRGLFEDRTNYEKLAKLMEKGIPFVIVLNDRGCPIDKRWNEEQKKRARFDHDQELKVIQYKIIKNLTKESGDQRIADRYEVVTLNAKKAWTGVVKDKPQLYEASGVEFLERRISQLLSNDASVAAVFQQPILNLKECFNEAEKRITQEMSGNASEDFAMRLHVLESKRDNIMQDMRVLTRQAVRSRVEELANSYVNGDGDIFETIANSIFMDVDDRYCAKVNELLVYVDQNFRDLNLYLDNMSNLMFDSEGRTGSALPEEDVTDAGPGMEETTLPPEKPGFFDFLKSRKRRERERQERLEREAQLRNERVQYEIQEKIRRKQEARQLAESDLDILYREFNDIVNAGMDEKYDELISQIQEIDCLNKQAQEDGRRRMERIRELRKALSAIENSLN